MRRQPPHGPTCAWPWATSGPAGVARGDDIPHQGRPLTTTMLAPRTGAPPGPLGPHRPATGPISTCSRVASTQAIYSAARTAASTLGWTKGPTSWLTTKVDLATRLDVAPQVAP